LPGTPTVTGVRTRTGVLSRARRAAAVSSYSPRWFRDDLERVFARLASGAIHPRIAERISFDEVAEAHRRLEAGGLDGKLVLCPEPPLH
jgi:NADPH2:quinone reductase